MAGHMVGDVSGHVARALEGPPPQLTYRRALRPGAMLQELWHARELVTVLTERELRVRYKQTKMGFAWALALPLMMMVVFAVFFSEAVEVDTGGVPDPLYFYVGLLPWTFFASSVSIGALSITTNLSLINKVYCPREVFPLSAIGTAGVDGLVASSVLALLFVVYGRIPESTVVWLPALMAVQLAFTVGVTLLLAALVVYLRDLRQVLPMVVQFAMFATPVAYNLDDYLAERWQPVASALNPLVPVIDGYRSTVLLGDPPQGGLLAIAAVSSLVVLLGGFLVFKRLETGFADVA